MLLSARWWREYVVMSHMTIEMSKKPSKLWAAEKIETERSCLPSDCDKLNFKPVKVISHSLALFQSEPRKNACVWRGFSRGERNGRFVRTLVLGEEKFFQSDSFSARSANDGEPATDRRRSLSMDITYAAVSPLTHWRVHVCEYPVHVHTRVEEEPLEALEKGSKILFWGLL